jgi:hypothetical protein
MPLHLLLFLPVTGISQSHIIPIVTLIEFLDKQ